MNFLFCLTPIIVCLASVSRLPVNALRWLVPIAFWTNLAIALGISLPIFRTTLQEIVFGADFGMDRISASFLLLTNFVAACTLTHATSFFKNECQIESKYSDRHERWFYFNSALFIAAMNVVYLTFNLGVLWIAIEATTLFSAALVYHGRDKHALEATWKYLIVCSVGIAFALLGTILLFASSQFQIPHGTLDFRVLKTCAAQLQPKFVQLGFIFCLLGYGTKAGLFPLHTWLPDAHSEAPAPASAMLSGSLLNCALYAIFRLTDFVRLTSNDSLALNVPIVWGSITMLAASLFLVNQTGLKRLWAYSSIENVGIMLCAIGVGSPSLFFLQALNHSLAKVALFLVSGNIIQINGTKELSKIGGVITATPLSGLVMVLAAAAVTGMPPFGSFVSEWLILTRALDSGQLFCFCSLLIGLVLGFVAISAHVAKILLGSPREPQSTGSRTKNVSVAIPMLLCLISLLLGMTNYSQRLLAVL